MSFPRYPEYKESGVEWLGKVPSHWTVLPLSKTATEKNSVFIDGDWIESKDLSEEGIRYLTSGNVGEGLYKEQGAGFIDQEKFDQLQCTEVVPGDILISRLNMPVGRACIVPNLNARIVTCVDNVIVRTNTEFDREFLVYLLSSKQHFYNMEILARGSTMPRVSRSQLGRVRCAFPCLQEQEAISKFLDHETSKIDSLITEQERLIELLKEKRQAVIAHAVTKGLDPNVKMKDSGVEWLGEVPEHWGVKALKHIVKIPITDGPHETPEFFDEGVPFVSAEAISGGYIDFNKIRGHISPESHKKYSQKYSPQFGDIYMIKSGATTGVCAIVETHEEFNIWSPLAAIRCDDQADRYFVLNCLRSKNFQEAVALNWSFGTQQNIGMGVIENLQIPLPPIEEQVQIANHLSELTTKAERLIGEITAGLSLLQERRSALISAAVTGQIDVRTYHVS